MGLAEPLRRRCVMLSQRGGERGSWRRVQATLNPQPSSETHSAQGFKLGKMVLPRACPPALTFPVPGPPFLCTIVGGVHQQLSLRYAVSKN